MIVFDTDILSTFAKIDKLDLLFILFKGNKLVYTPSVKADLQKAKTKGYNFVDKIFNERFNVIKLSKKELNYKKQIEREKRNLGSGELEALVLCKLRKGVLITNDATAQKAAYELVIECLNLSDILYAFIKERILLKSDVEKLIAEIENKDKVKITDKNKILEE